MSEVRIKELNIYPIKSLGCISLSKMSTGLRGPEWDRHWMLVDDQGLFISQRKLPEMALFQTQIEEGLLKIQYGEQSLSIPLSETSQHTRDVQVWKDQFKARDMGDEIAQWFSVQLKQSCRLVAMDKEVRRPSKKWEGVPDGEAAFADGYPFLVTTEASLTDLNQRLKTPISMSRFRANIVIEGTEPYAEDHWKSIKIGGLHLFHAENCSRCIMTTTDQATAQRDREQEPLKTLSSYRQQGNKVFFGVNMIPESVGEVCVGDMVEVFSM